MQKVYQFCISIVSHAADKVKRDNRALSTGAPLKSKELA